MDFLFNFLMAVLRGIAESIPVEDGPSVLSEPSDKAREEWRRWKEWEMDETAAFNNVDYRDVADNHVCIVEIK